MVRFDCRRVPVAAFNKLAGPQGIRIESRDSWVDRGDRFERMGANGPHGISFHSDEVQSILKLWRADCAALMRRASSPQMRELALAYRVRFGPPSVPAEGDAERLGVYRGRRHLFDIDASAESGAGGPGGTAQFTVFKLARLIAEGLDSDIHPRYRARVSISRADRETMKGMGLRIDAARGEIRGPAGESFRYGGSLSEGFTRFAVIEFVSDALIRIFMHTDDGGHRTAVFPVKPAGRSGR